MTAIEIVLLDSGSPVWPGIVSAVAVLFAVMVAAAIPITAYARRPVLELRERPSESRLETDTAAYVRLMVSNRIGHRTAYKTRAEVVGFRPTDEEVPLTPIGNALLGWTSAAEDERGVAVYADADRPLDFGVLQKHPQLDADSPWYLRLALKDINIAEGREWLPPGRWSVRLHIGANDGDAAVYDVDVTWPGDAPTLSEALAELKLRLTQRPPRSLLGSWLASALRWASRASERSR